MDEAGSAKATGSPGLEADALHFLSEMLASGVVLIGMVFVTFGYMSADAIAALIVACFHSGSGSKTPAPIF